MKWEKRLIVSENIIIALLKLIMSSYHIFGKIRICILKVKRNYFKTIK